MSTIVQLCNKGRRRQEKHFENNMLELIYHTAIPRWQKYLSLKIQRGLNWNEKPRKDTLWKKIIRDVREFFRILFRNRFHYLDYKSTKTAKKWVKIFFDELGFDIGPKYINNMKLFTFLHQTHRSKSMTMFKSNSWEESPFDIIEKYNEMTRKLFMTDLVWAKMFYFVYENLMEHYVNFVKIDYRHEVITLICLLLNCYSKMRSPTHIERIWFLFEI